MQHPEGKAASKSTAHYHLAKQLRITHDAGLGLKTPAYDANLRDNSLANIIGSLKPHQYGTQRPNPTHDGPTSLGNGAGRFARPSRGETKQEKAVPAFLSFAGLQNKHGSIVKNRLKQAINRPTKIVNSVTEGTKTLRWQKLNHTSTLSPEEKTIRIPRIFTELRYAAGGCGHSQDLQADVNEAMRRWHEAPQGQCDSTCNQILTNVGD